MKLSRSKISPSKISRLRLFACLGLVQAMQAAFAANVAFAGGSSAHGGDLDRDEDNIWFLGDAPVEYCIERADDYPLSADQLGSLVGEAISDWQAFFAKYGMDQMTFANLADGSSRRMALTFTQVATCQYPEKQLLFAFDTKDKLVDDHRPDFDSSLGMAVRGAYDHDTYRTGGVVWIAHWTDQTALVKHMVLHELGHVFGMAHNSVWVMDDTVAIRVTNPEEAKDPAIGKIESPAWPFLLRDGDTLDFTYRNTCGSAPVGYSCNWALNITAFDLFGLNNNDWFNGHRLTLKYATEFDPGAELPFGRKGFTMVFEQPGKPAQEFKGFFDVVYLSGSGPSLYTRFKDPTSGALTADKRWLVQAAFPVPASGYFLTGSGTKIPVIISTHWGPVLRMFIPSTGDWWNTESYDLSLERQQMDQY